MDIDVTGELSQEVVEEMFTWAIAGALQIPIQSVLKLNATEIQLGEKLAASAVGNLRRLQSTQTQRYEVSYIVEVPSHMADAVVERANQIAVPGSEESKLFRKALTDTDGVVGVGRIVSTVPAYKVGDKRTTVAPQEEPTEEEKKGWSSVAIVAIIVVGVVAGMIAVAYLIKRKMKVDESTAIPSTQAPKRDEEEGNNLVNGVVLEIPAEAGSNSNNLVVDMPLDKGDNGKGQTAVVPTETANASSDYMPPVATRDRPSVPATKKTVVEL